MKKITMTIGTVMTALGLYAGVLTNVSYKVSFENDEPGVNATDMKFTPGAVGADWTGITDPILLGAYDGDAYVYSGANVRRPEFPNGVSVQNCYLKLDTDTSTLEHAVGEDDVFVDQLINFTGYEDVQTNVTGKVAVWMSEFSNDNGTETTTNLYVTVGQDTQSGIEKIAVKIDDPSPGTKWELGKWYRLTVKKLGSVKGSGETARQGFAIYIDGNQLSSSDAAAKTQVTDIDSAFADLQAAGRLFSATSLGDTITKVGYQGVGAIDDLMLDNLGPEALRSVTATVADAPTGSVLTITPDGAYTLVDGVLTTAPGTTLTFTYSAAAGYRMATVVRLFTISGGEEITTPAEVQPKFVIAGVSDGSVSSNCVTVAETFGAVRYFELQGAEEISVDARADIPATEITGYGTIALSNTATLVITPANKTWTFGTAAATLLAPIAAEATVTATAAAPLTYGGTVAGTLTADTIVQSGAIKLTGAGTIATKTGDLTVTTDDAGMKISKTELAGTYTYSVVSASTGFAIIIAGQDPVYYESLEAAIDAYSGAANEKVAFMANYTTSGTLAINKDLVIDINGFEVTVGGTSVAANKNLKLLNSKLGYLEAGSGWLKITKSAAVIGTGATLDMTAFPMGQDWHGIHTDSIAAGGFSIASGATVKFIAGSGQYTWKETQCVSPNFMAANFPGTFGTGTASGAKIQFGGIDAIWTYDGSLWVINDGVATAKLTGVPRTGTIAAGTTCDFTESYATVSDAIAASSDNKVTVTADAAVASSDAVEGLEISIAEGAKLTVSGSELAQSVTIKGAGALEIENALTVSATLDLSNLSYSQTTGCTGGFALNANTSKVVFQSDVTYPACLGAINSKVSGAQIAAGGVTYTTDGSQWRDVTCPWFGDGKSAETAYQIKTVADLQALQTWVATTSTVGVYFKQMNDIDMDVNNGGVYWSGIGGNQVGTYENAFCGVYNGQNFKILNVTFANSETANTKYMGFFQSANGATIENLTINVSGFRYPESTKEFGGAAFVGIATKGGITLRNLTATGSMSGNHNFGGIAVKLGHKDESAAADQFLVENCTNKMSLTSTYSKVGGMVAFCQRQGKGSETNAIMFVGCSNEAELHGNPVNTSSGVAGMVGWYNDIVKYENCSSTGACVADNGNNQWACSFVGDNGNSPGYKAISLGGNKTTLTGNSPVAYAPCAVGFNFATVDDGTATFVEDTLVPGTTTYNVMLTNTVAQVLTDKDDQLIIKNVPAEYKGPVTTTVEGYEVTTNIADEVKTFALKKAGPDPVVPGEPISSDDPAGDAKKINEGGVEAKKAVIQPPTGATVPDAYYNLFSAVPGTGTVTMMLNENGTNAVVAAETVLSTNALTSVLAITTATGTTDVTIASPLAGFYYSFKQGDAVDGLGYRVEGDKNKVGGKDIIKFSAEKTSSSARFFQTIVTPSPLK